MEIAGKQIKAQIWDTAGQERYRAITNAYYRGAVGAMVVYAINNRASFTAVERWLAEVRAHGSADMVIILVGNKNDLDGEREVTVEEGKVCVCVRFVIVYLSF